MPRLKRILVPALVAAGVFAAGAARASEPVVLFLAPDGGPEPSELGNALSVQLLGAAELKTGALPSAPNVAERIAAARALGHDAQAMLVVWAEGPSALPDGSQEAVLYAVGEREGRALLEVVRVPGGQGPDMDRTLALKVRDMVDELARQETQAPGETMLSAAKTPEDARAQLGLALGLTLAGRSQAGTAFGQWGGAVAAGPSARFADARIAALAELRVLPALTLDRPDARIRYQEIAPWFVVHGQMRFAALWLGAHSGIGLAFAHAEGTTAAGTPGAPVDQRRLTARVGLDAEAVLGGGLGLALGVELEIDARRQRYAVNQREAFDLGRFAPFVTLGLRYASR